MTQQQIAASFNVAPPPSPIAFMAGKILGNHLVTVFGATIDGLADALKESIGTGGMSISENGALAFNEAGNGVYIEAIGTIIRRVYYYEYNI